MSDFKARRKCTQFFSAGAPLQTLLGELTALPQTTNCISMAAEGEEERGIEMEGEGERREREGGEGTEEATPPNILA